MRPRYAERPAVSRLPVTSRLGETMATRSTTGTQTKRKARTAYLLAQAHFAMRLKIDEALKAFDVTGLQYTVLSLVSLHPGLSSAELSRRFIRTQQAMGQLLSGLEEKGWLMREEDPANRRILRVVLTDLGRNVVMAGGKALDAVEEQAFAGFAKSEIDTFRAVLESLTAKPQPDKAA
jgi:DNA-binding MarR family transcriptional regulator